MCSDGEIAERGHAELNTPHGGPREAVPRRQSSRDPALAFWVAIQKGLNGPVRPIIWYRRFSTQSLSILLEVLSQNDFFLTGRRLLSSRPSDAPAGLECTSYQRNSEKEAPDLSGG